MNKRWNPYRTFAEGFLLMNVIWFIASVIIDLNVVPNPILVYQNFGSTITNEVYIHIFHSLKRIFTGLALSLGVGIPIGIAMANSPKINRFLYPLIYFSYPIPKTALLPVAMLLLGMRDGSKVAIIFLIIVFQVIVSVRDSVNHIDPAMYQVVKSAGAGKGQMIWHVTLPAILPELLTSIRISLGTALSILFFVEGYGTKYGMGYYILDAWSRINYIDMYIGIIVIAIIGFILFISMDFIADKLCKGS